MGNFMNRLRATFARFMTGRYGSDQLNFAIIVLALVLTVLGSLTRFFPLTLLSDAGILLALFRMLSRDRYRRAQENMDYLQKTERIRREAAEWANRMKNRKQFCYFSCPKCKKRLRVPRGVGKITITCRDCGTKFDKKA